MFDLKTAFVLISQLLKSCENGFSKSSSENASFLYESLTSFCFLLLIIQDGIKSTIESFSRLAKDSSFMRDNNFREQSKAVKLLGSGMVADVLLWREIKRTLLCFLILASLFYWFFLCGRTFTSSVAKLLLLVTVTLYGYGNLSSKM
ncbi:hypothetical protein Gotur_034520 [Gossypium turneri]